MVNIARANSDYSCYFHAGKYYCDRNCCGEESANKTGDTWKTVLEAAITELGSNGGTIFLKQLQIPAGLSWGAFGSKILIIEDYQGERTYYRDGAKLFELEDLAALVEEIP